MTSIAFIGAGNMASAIIGGLVKNGFNPANIWASDPSLEKANGLAAQFSIHATTDNIEAIQQCDVVMLAVKPQVMESVLSSLKPALNAKPTLLISVAAGINLASLACWGGEELAIVRCMPNTPALVMQGASGLFANEQVSDAQKIISEDILNAVGISVWVNSEDEIDSVIAVSGSGPAYFFLFMEAMIAAGQKLGLSEQTAKQLTLKTALGAATMASSSEHSPAQLRKNVTSPNGTTEQAILSFQRQNLEGIVETAMQAAYDRSGEMCKELGVKN